MAASPRIHSLLTFYFLVAFHRISAASSSSSSSSSATGRLWTNGIIPFEIRGFHSLSYAEDRITSVLREWTTETCLRFSDISKLPDKSAFFASLGHRSMLIFKENDHHFGDDCRSLCIDPPKLPSEIVYVSISRPCLEDKRWLSHQVGHAIGLGHEHQRADRDGVITVHFDNVIPSAKKFFGKDSYGDHPTYGLSYNILSVMHFEKRQFAKDPHLTTFTPKGGYTFGEPSDGPTASDKALVRITLCDGAIEGRMTPKPSITRFLKNVSIRPSDQTKEIGDKSGIVLLSKNEVLIIGVFTLSFIIIIIVALIFMAVNKRKRAKLGANKWDRRGGGGGKEAKTMRGETIELAVGRQEERHQNEYQTVSVDATFQGEKTFEEKRKGDRGRGLDYKQGGRGLDDDRGRNGLDCERSGKGPELGRSQSGVSWNTVWEEDLYQNDSYFN